MIKLACDIDGVLADCDGPFCAEINLRLGTDVTPADMTNWNFFQDFLVGKVSDPGAFLCDIWWSEGFMAKQPFVLPALPAMRRIRGLVDRLEIVTSRKTEGRPWVKEVTRLWLDRHGIDYDRVVHTDDKAGYCREHGFTYLIDDAPHHARAVADAGIRVFLVDMPYNRDVAEGASGFGRGRVTRVAHIGEVPDALRRDLA